MATCSGEGVLRGNLQNNLDSAGEREGSGRRRIRDRLYADCFAKWWPVQEMKAEQNDLYFNPEEHASSFA